MGDQPTPTDRRQPRHQHEWRGGRRATDPPLTTGDCADWMGVGRDFIRGAIADPDPAKRLEAEDIEVNGRRLIRIHHDDFCAWLEKIGWKRIPRRLPPEPAARSLKPEVDRSKSDSKSDAPSSPAA